MKYLTPIVGTTIIPMVILFGMFITDDISDCDYFLWVDNGDTKRFDKCEQIKSDAKTVMILTGISMIGLIWVMRNHFNNMIVKYE